MSWSATGEHRGPLETAIAIGVVVLVAGIAAALVFGSRSSDERVTIIGDSITAWSAGLVGDQIGGRYAAKIDATSGARIDEKFGAAGAAVSRDNEQIIINLGTNDVMQADTDLDLSIIGLQDMVAMFPAARCIHLVTVNEAIRTDDQTASKLTARARQMNEAIWAMADADPRITVMDWNAMVDEYEAANGGDSPTVDTVHPNASGTHLLVDGYENALDSCPDA